MRTLLVIITQHTNLKTTFTAVKSKQRKFTWNFSKSTKRDKMRWLTPYFKLYLAHRTVCLSPNFYISKIRWVILSTLCKSNPRSGVLADWTCQVSHVKESLIADSRILVIETKCYIKILQLKGFSTFSSMFPAANVVK